MHAVDDENGSPRSPSSTLLRANSAERRATESKTMLEVEIGDETRAQRGAYPASLVVGTKPF